MTDRSKSFYSIPRWCRFPPLAHFYGMGASWAIDGRLVDRKGRSHCKTRGGCRETQTL